MSKQTFRKYERLKGRIREILVTYWDPLGVNKYPHVWDEYDPYLFRIFKRIEDGSTEEDIANYLVSLEVHSMGLSPADEVRASEAAVRLVALLD
ncbi:hypothetical protein FRC96_12430 [Lujinxingia vulgaris]|uniref:Uncharacterized protein n=1 Tax=Lujinxingia vulgaris TaxID=2600176 RepID=A0A5C6X3L2_9DELT|nr:hypothetical protein [Lujinxingia vulgaris]TXD34860.1 hypothetical protein FRC96_12430 [Lujinxingia vulgaris]